MPVCPHTRCVGLKPWFLVLLLPLLLYNPASAQNSIHATDKIKGDGAGFKLSVGNNRVSLDAKQASLKMILETIAQKLNIDATIRIPQEEKVTIQFEDQSLEEALKLFVVNFALVSDTKAKDGPVKQIVVVPQGQQAQLAVRPSGNADQKITQDSKAEEGKKTQPFKFEFDPSKYANHPN